MISKNDSPVPAEEDPEEVLSPVARAARLVLEIVPGERRFLPAFGCRIHEVESLATPASRELAAAFVEEALERWAPALRIDRSEVSPSAEGEIAIRLRAGGSWHALRIAHRHRAGQRAREAERT